MASLLAISCTKEPESSSSLDADRPITFVTATYNSQTKAGSDTLADNAFHVSAWTTGGIRYMNDVEVTKSGAVWSTTSAYYWPKADSLRFVGTHGRISGSPWAAVNDACTKISTGSDIVFRPALASQKDALFLYTDRTAKYTYTSGDVPIIFKNALSAVKSTINVRMSDDVIKKDGSGMYRVYDVYAPADSAGKTTYYVVPFGFSPNGALPPNPPFPYPTEPYPIKVQLKKKITHIWRIYATKISSRNVGNTGRLEMTLGSDGVWQKPSNDVWTVPANASAHTDSVVYYSAAAKGDVNGTPVPANLNDFDCPVSDYSLVMPQDLNWSAASSINNPKADVYLTVEVFNKDINEDGIFDYRDVYKHYVVKTKSGDKVTDSTLIDTPAKALDNKGKEFYKWYEWDGTGSSVLYAVHQQYVYLKQEYKKKGIDVPNVTFAQVLDGLTPHLKYPLTSTVDLAKISSDESSKYWKMNTRTTYRINISPVTDEITFSPEVTQWVDDGNATVN